MTNRQFESECEDDCMSVNLFTPRRLPAHRSNDWPAYTIMAALILLVAVSVILHRYMQP